MVGKVEKNRIIRLKRLANYYRSRYDNGELTSKQRTQAMANANAVSWAVAMAINDIEHREKERIRLLAIDRMVKFLRARKYWRLKSRYDAVEIMVRELHIADIMDHERTFDGQAAKNEKAQAEKDAAS